MRVAFLTDNYLEKREIQDPFRHELLAAFIKASSEVLYIQTDDFISHDGNFYHARERESVCQALRGFNPDLVFSLNRAGMNETVMAEIRCPIVTWYIDNITRFSPKLKRVRTSEERVYTSSRYQVEVIRAEIPGAKVEYLPFCANTRIFRPGDDYLKPDACDVSYVGTLWDPSPVMDLVDEKLETDEAKDWFLENLRAYECDYEHKLPELIVERFGYPRVANQLKSYIDDFLSTRSRLSVLEALTSLKLEIHGTRSWLGQSLLRSNELFQAFSPEPIHTSQELADLYRRSRICLSIGHAQAQSGFPIRIWDILATGAPLVTDRHSELNELFEEGRDFLSYATPAEARECVQRILEDPALSARMRNARVEGIREMHDFGARTRTLLGADSAAQGKGRKLHVLSKVFVGDSFRSPLAREGVEVDWSDYPVGHTVRGSRPRAFSRLMELASLGGRFVGLSLRMLATSKGEGARLVSRRVRGIGADTLNLLRANVRQLESETRFPLKKRGDRC